MPSASAVLLVLVSVVVGSVNASSKSFLRERKDETKVGASPKYTVMHESIKAEENLFWTRLLHETDMSVPAPVAPPVAVPTEAPPTGSPPTTAPTSAPTCELQNVDICLSIDQSGSICGDIAPSQVFQDCPLAQQSPFCCDNYKQSVEFATGVVDAVEKGLIDAGLGMGQYGLVTFANSAEVTEGLTDAMTVTDALATTEYTAGATNTAGGISACTSVLENGTQERRILVLLTDGNPTAPDNEEKATDEANNEATAARIAGIQVLPVGVGTGISISNLETWAGTDEFGEQNLVLSVGNFTDLPDIVDQLVQELSCSP